MVEEGPHDMLMAQQGAYFNLVQAQARNMDAEAAGATPVERDTDP